MNLRWKRIRELFGYAGTLLKTEGPVTLLRRGAGFAKRRLFGKRARYLPVGRALKAQRAENTTQLPVISILTPLYNTPKNYLRQFLDSAQSQTCGRWELCLADASDDAHAEVGRIVQARAAQDPRIHWQKIKNEGIAANTNAAARMATGDYLALADHDDVSGAPCNLYDGENDCSRQCARFCTGLFIQ